MAWNAASRRGSTLERFSGFFCSTNLYGIKPPYYADHRGTLRFALQVRALLAGGALPRTPDPAGQVGFYLWGSVPEPFTSHQAI